MTDIIAMHSAEPVLFGVVKIIWKDGFAGIVDLRPMLAKGEMFNFLRVNPFALTISSSNSTVTLSSGLTTIVRKYSLARTPCVGARSDKLLSLSEQVEHKRVRSCQMAEEIDLRFLGEQIRHLQGDVRQLKSDVAQMRADNVRVDNDVVALSVALSSLDGKVEAFRESVDDRFDQHVELIKSSFRTSSQETAMLRQSVGDRFESVDRRFESVDARFEQQLEFLKSSFRTLSQEIATLKKS